MSIDILLVPILSMLRVYLPASEQPLLVQAGDVVRFSPISLQEFEEKQMYEFTCYPQIRNVAGHETSQCNVLDLGMLTTAQDDCRWGLHSLGRCPFQGSWTGGRRDLWQGRSPDCGEVVDE